MRDEQLSINVSGQGNCPVCVGVIGDSLGDPRYGGYVPYLQGALERAGTQSTIIDRASSGATSSYGPRAAREMVAMDNPPQIVVLELGGNDLLGETDPETVKNNLQETISILKDNNIQVVLSGMQAPNFVPEPYRSEFNAIYPDLAADNNIILDPLIYESVLANREGGNLRTVLDQRYMRNDGIHFNPAGARLTAEGLVPEIQEAATRLPEPPCP